MFAVGASFMGLSSLLGVVIRTGGRGASGGGSGENMDVSGIVCTERERVVVVEGH